MIILKSRIDPMEGFMNDPHPYFLVDKIPKAEELIYEEKGGCYFAEKDGYVSFFFYKKPGEGYAGRRFPIKVRRGDEIIDFVLRGPWSSRSGVMNKLGFEPCLECTITDDPAVFERGFTFYAAAVTVALIEQYPIEGWKFVKKEKFDDEIYYVFERINQEDDQKGEER